MFCGPSGSGKGWGKGVERAGRSVTFANLRISKKIFAVCGLNKKICVPTLSCAYFVCIYPQLFGWGKSFVCFNLFVYFDVLRVYNVYFICMYAELSVSIRVRNSYLKYGNVC